MPTNNLIYSQDNVVIPAFAPPSPAERIVKRGNFFEFVRINFGNHPIISKNGSTLGSRASAFVPWKMRGDVTRDPSGNWDFTQGQEALNIVGPGHDALGDHP